MANAWNNYAAVNDDIRHTYERVFYGRETTGNLTPNDVPGMENPWNTAKAGPGQEPAQPAADQAGPTGADLYGRDPSHEERQATAQAWQHAENAPGIRQEIEQAEGRPYMHTDAAPLEPRGSVYGPATEGKASTAQALYGPASEPAPAVSSAPEPQAAPQPTAGNDMTPG